jgi:hypothetical protein
MRLNNIFGGLAALALSLLAPIANSQAIVTPQMATARYILSNARTPVSEAVTALTVTRTQSAAYANSTILTDKSAYAPLYNLQSNGVYCNGPINVVVGSPNIYQYTGGAVPPGQAPQSNRGWACSFMTDASVVEIDIRDTQGVGGGTSQHWNCRVNGLLCSATDYTLSTSSGANFYYDKVDFGASSQGVPKRIDIYLDGGAQLYGFNIGPSAGTTSALTPYRLWSVPPPYSHSELWMGDSYIFGNGTAVIRSTIAYQAGELLGSTNIVANGCGGSGYLNTNGGTCYTLLNRINAGELSNYPNLDMLIIEGGINDNIATAAQETAAVTATVKAAQAKLPPKTIIVVTGAWQAPGDLPGSAIIGAIGPAVIGANDGRTCYIPVSDDNPPWQDTTTTAPSNYTIYIAGNTQSDTIHNNTLGQVYNGQRFAQSVIKNCLLPMAGYPYP